MTTGFVLAIIAPNYTRARPLGNDAIPYDVGQLLGHSLWVVGGFATSVQGGANILSGVTLGAGSGGSASAPALVFGAVGSAQVASGVVITGVGVRGLERDARDLLSHMSGDESNSGTPPPNSGVTPQLSRQDLSSIESLEARAAEHETKLAEYRADPWRFDNQGHLARNRHRPDVIQRIVEGRVRHLEQEIRNFRQQIQALRSGGGR
jgi:hypothetical protein